MRLEREARVEVVRGVVDERLPLLGAHVVAEQIADERLHLRVVREQDVRPEVEDVAVDHDRARVAARLALLLEHEPVALSAMLQRVRSGQPGEPGAEDDVTTDAHGAVSFVDSARAPPSHRTDAACGRQPGRAGTMQRVLTIRSGTTSRKCTPGPTPSRTGSRSPSSSWAMCAPRSWRCEVEPLMQACMFRRRPWSRGMRDSSACSAADRLLGCDARRLRDRGGHPSRARTSSPLASRSPIPHSRS